MNTFWKHFTFLLFLVLSRMCGWTELNKIVDLHVHFGINVIIAFFFDYRWVMYIYLAKLCRKNKGNSFALDFLWLDLSIAKRLSLRVNWTLAGVPSLIYQTRKKRRTSILTGKCFAFPRTFTLRLFSPNIFGKFLLDCFLIHSFRIFRVCIV